MTVRCRFLLAGLLGLWVAHPLPGQEPSRLNVEPSASLAPNQQLANAIAEQLRQSGQLRHYAVDVTCRNGTVEVSGVVADQPQREEVLRIVQGVPGVERVIDLLTPTSTGITRVQAGAPAGEAPVPMPSAAPPIPEAGAVPAEPYPIGASPVSPYDLGHPKMPPYAWPTYAPYNNYSRVAYPEAYPYNAWPFIGPIYPFPKVPLGWRSVKLHWDDGYWWYSRTASKYDWWKLRFW
jgi:BON domain